MSVVASLRARKTGSQIVKARLDEVLAAVEPPAPAANIVPLNPGLSLLHDIRSAKAGNQRKPNKVRGDR